MLKYSMDHDPDHSMAQFRWFVTIGLVLSALVVGGFATAMVRIDRTDDKIMRLEERLGRFEERQGRLEERLARLEASVAEVPGKISQQLLELNRTIMLAVASKKDPDPQPPPLEQIRRPDFGAIGPGAPSGPRLRVPPTPDWALPPTNAPRGPTSAPPDSGLK